MINFRTATHDDVSKISKLERESFSHPFRKQDVLYELEENDFSIIMVATDDEKVVAYIDFWITFDSATICRIAVNPLYRKRGIGLELLKLMEKRAKAEKCSNITLEVREGNIEAIGLYQKFGFIVITKKIQFYDDGENAIYMVKGV
ncbi:MAG: ribosomal protein S18-alanine N-acetyltransferase [Bacilli bacterium]